MLQTTVELREHKQRIDIIHEVAVMCTTKVIRLNEANLYVILSSSEIICYLDHREKSSHVILNSIISGPFKYFDNTDMTSQNKIKLNMKSRNKIR